MPDKNVEASRPVIDIDENGYLVLDTGTTGNIITQLGKRDDGEYHPWSKNVENGVRLFSSYVVKDGFYPIKFKSSAEFVQNLRDQAFNNPYVQNYVDLGIEMLLDYLQSFDLVDGSTKYLFINNNSDLTDILYNEISNHTNNAYNDIIELGDQVDVEKLFVNDHAPKEAHQYFDPILDELRKVDAYYTFEELNFEKDMLKYLSGFADINYENLNNNHQNSDIVLVCDVFSSGYTYLDVYNQLKRNGFTNVTGFIALITQI